MISTKARCYVRTESVADYVSRMRGLARGTDSLQILRSTTEEIASLVRDVNHERLVTRPAPHKWSISEIVAHLADAEMVTGFRLRQVISSSNGIPIPAYDQDAWAAVCNYARIPLHESLALFTALRLSNLRLWEHLSPAQLNMFGIHAERGRESAQDLLTLITGHDINHLAQIRKIVST